MSTQAKRALQEYKRVLSKSLKEGTGMDFRSKDLAAWNQKQFQLWTQAAKDGLVPRNDAKKFGEFGQFFFNHVDKTEEYPDYDDVLDWIDDVI